MPFYLFTFRPQITEQDLFENFVTIFSCELDRFMKYSYSIEEDNTLNKHLHCLVESNAKDNNAFKQIFNKKIFKDFKSTLKNKQTNEHGFDDRKVKDDPEDFLKVLGYVNKETQCLRRKYKGFTNEEILKAVEYYYTTKHIDKEKNINNDLIILTPKNYHIHLKTQAIKHGLQPDDPLLTFRMRKDGYCFGNIPDKVEVKCKKDLRIHMDSDITEENIFGGDEPPVRHYEDLQHLCQRQATEIRECREMLALFKKRYPFWSIDGGIYGCHMAEKSNNTEEQLLGGL